MKWGLREWYVLSFLMGLYFVLGQGYEYMDLITKQHLTLIIRLRLGVLPDHRVPRPARHRRTDRLHLPPWPDLWAKRFTHEQQVSAIVVSYYWHFVDVVWIGLFTTIYLIH